MIRYSSIISSPENFVNIDDDFKKALIPFGKKIEDKISIAINYIHTQKESWVFSDSRFNFYFMKMSETYGKSTEKKIVQYYYTILNLRIQIITVFKEFI